MNKWLLSMVLVVGCGGGTGAGETECGSVTCSAGQYCSDPVLSWCENGCVSDANCANGDECVITNTTFNDGVCMGSDPDDEPDTGVSQDPLQACQDACGHFQSCGLSAAEAAQCRDDCAGLTQSQQESIAACDDLSCNDTLSCVGQDCFSDDDCGSGETCLDYTCL